MKKFARALLDRTPYISRLRQGIKAMGEYPAGSYYSPIPSQSDIRERFDRTPEAVVMPEIDLRRDDQRALLDALQPHYDRLPFTQEPSPSQRYSLASECFGQGNGIVLHAFLRHFQPKRIVEIGSGSSSMLIMDTLAAVGDVNTQVTFIDGWPDNIRRLESQLTAKERQRCTVLGQRVQEVSLEVFRSLQAGDLLFVASSHVMKYGSDVERIIFEVLPALAPGVLVRFHNVYFPFEYPREWLLQGRFWNESPFLRAFLAFNAAWRIRYFDQYAAREFKEHLHARMPLVLIHPGSGIYLERIA
ncbi:hypothetical protein AYO49_01050 [Verrucomicrobiaceae bacterium SCGC AG-212-N21]|nr:hypothetical protein AYO49_01050 [Verrucomicrobiaceae bacterium SCGC AG-212-N21]